MCEETRQHGSGKGRRKRTRATGTSPIGLLGLIFLGMVIAGVGVGLLIRRYADANPIKPSTERAREAGRRWTAEIQEQERRREADDDAER